MNEENKILQLNGATGKQPQTSVSRGGRTCCVPHCNSNSRQRPDLSFHKIPQEPILKNKWLKMLTRRGLCNPGPNHTVCSAHFPGGKKTYENNIPTIMAPVVSETSGREKELKTNSNDQPNVSSLVPIPVNESSFHQEPMECLLQSATGNENLEKQLQHLQAKHDKLQKKYDDDIKAMEQQLFRMERFIGSDHDFRFYTGFPDYSTFKVFFDYLSPACNSLIYYGSTTGILSSQQQKKRGKPRSICPEQELFMVLVRLRCGLLIEDIAHRYNLSSTHVSRIWITWLTFLHQQLRALPIWPSRKFIDDNMPECFKNTFPETRVIIDCTEIFIETPSSCRSQSATFSTYKHHNTAKGLLGISPNGYPSFVSNLYAGRTSDKKITKDCGILKLLEAGDQLMADRGFDIEGDLPAGVSLNIPAFLNGKMQLSHEEETSTRRIASVRVHVERAIARIKNFRILQHVFPNGSAQNLDKIWTVCSHISLFMPPLIEKI